MRQWILTLGLAMGLGMNGPGFGGETGGPPPQLQLDLTDGSRLLGFTSVTSVVVRTSFATVHVPLSQIRDLQMQRDRENAVLRLHNGDQLSGVPGIEAIPLATLFGDHAVGIRHISRITFRATRGLPSDLAEFLVLHYAFDRDEEHCVTDLSSKGNNGTRIGPQFTPNGKSGGGLYFDGVDDYVAAGNPPSLQLTTNFTLAAWIWPERTQDSFGIITKSHGGPEQQRRGIEFVLGHDDTLSAYFWNESTRFFTGVVKDKTIPRQEWVHVALLHDSALPQHQMLAFVNGVPCAMNYGYETISSIPVVRNVAEPVRIGCMRPGVHHFKGRIDEVMIFNRQLSADEIARLYECMR